MLRGVIGWPTRTIEDRLDLVEPVGVVGCVLEGRRFDEILKGR